jgi:SAM-dependent MidA family methyltransferase
VSTLFDIIGREAAERGVLPFARFMELALYCPVHGYYETKKDNPGRHGDFYTSVGVGELFGQLLACQFAEWLETLNPQPSILNLVEAGAHDGRLARDILAWLQLRRPELFEQIEYWIIEPSARRQEWQKETLKDFAPRVRWFESFQSISSPNPKSEIRNPKLNGVIFSNELLDAMPVHRFGWDAQNKKWFEWGVAVDGEKFVWARIPDSLPMNLLGAPASRRPVGSRKPELAGETPALPGTVPQFRGSKREVSSRRNLSPLGGAGAFDPSSIFHLPSSLLAVLPDGYTIEISPAAESWWREAAQVLERGKLLTIDYGFTADELFSPGRRHGTLRAYFRHHASDDLLANVGGQDLTAHVNFSAIQKAGEACGLATENLSTQSQFLTRILEATLRKKTFGEWTSVQARQFQTLTHPEHLGRAFRVLVQSR